MKRELLLIVGILQTFAQNRKTLVCEFEKNANLHNAGILGYGKAEINCSLTCHVLIVPPTNPEALKQFGTTHSRKYLTMILVGLIHILKDKSFTLYAAFDGRIFNRCNVPQCLNHQGSDFFNNWSIGRAKYTNEYACLAPLDHCYE